MRKPCQDDHGEYRAGCRVCHLWATDPRYAAIDPGAAPPPAPKRAAPAPCPHRSAEPTGEAGCKTCGGRVTLKVFGCGLHGTCTVGRRVEGHACCATCPDRPSPDRHTRPAHYRHARPARPETRRPPAVPPDPSNPLTVLGALIACVVSLAGVIGWLVRQYRLDVRETTEKHERSLAALAEKHEETVSTLIADAKEDRRARDEDHRDLVAAIQAVAQTVGDLRHQMTGCPYHGTPLPPHPRPPKGDGSGPHRVHRP